MSITAQDVARAPHTGSMARPEKLGLYCRMAFTFAHFAACAVPERAPNARQRFVFAA
jgi:hypothetical protein